MIAISMLDVSRVLLHLVSTDSAQRISLRLLGFLFASHARSVQISSAPVCESSQNVSMLESWNESYITTTKTPQAIDLLRMASLLILADDQWKKVLMRCDNVTCVGIQFFASP